jgi:hypothetical protein
LYVIPPESFRDRESFLKNQKDCGSRIAFGTMTEISKECGFTFGLIGSFIVSKNSLSCIELPGNISEVKNKYICVIFDFHLSHNKANFVGHSHSPLSGVLQFSVILDCP